MGRMAGGVMSADGVTGEIEGGEGGGCDQAADADGGGGGGAGGVKHVDHSGGGLDGEIIDKLSGGVQGLSADAGSTGEEVFDRDFGHQLLEGLEEGLLAEGAMHFADARFPELEGHLPEGRVGEGLEEVTGVDLSPGIAMATEGENGVGSGFDAAGDHAGKMDAEEREGGVWDGVNEIPAEGPSLGSESVVFAAERDDLKIGLEAAHSGDAIGLESAAVDESLGGEVALGGVEDDGVGFLRDFEDFGGGKDLASMLSDGVSVGVGDSFVVDDAGFSDVHAGDSCDVGFILADFIDGQSAEVGQTVGGASALEFV